MNDKANGALTFTTFFPFHGRIFFARSSALANNSFFNTSKISVSQNEEQGCVYRVYCSLLTEFYSVLFLRLNKRFRATVRIRFVKRQNKKKRSRDNEYYLETELALKVAKWILLFRSTSRYSCKVLLHVTNSYRIPVEISIVPCRQYSYEKSMIIDKIRA